jgi:protein-tyrosine-phosphatase/DNA-binding transcriptional ArsR family regulator
MKIERTDLEERAARHAALSDPARLRIVDLLTLGDLSPTELQTQLGMSSSLLAHHLNLLEHEGIVARARSEADRRRSYVRMIPGSLEHLGAASVGAAHRIVFVCTANSARSQIAAALWGRASSIPAISAGTHPAQQIDPGALAAAERHGFKLRGRKPQSLSSVAEADDFYVTVCDVAHEELGAVPGLHWSVPDPVRDGSDQAFDAAFENIARRIGELAPRLAAA